jgi:hypothetical protein
MKARRFMVVLVALLGAKLFAADFWEKKRFPDWSAKEIRKLLTDSPWARPVLVPLETLHGQQASPVPHKQVKGACQQCSVGGAPVFLQSSDMPELAGPLTVTVRWHSALPLKQALAKLLFGDEVSTSAAAAELLSREDDSYVVGLSSLPRQVVPEDLESIKSGAVLKVRNGPSIPAIPAREARVKAEGDMVNLLLFFPKPQGGTPGITLEHREIELGVKLFAIEIKRKFKLSEMVYQGKLEL